MNREQIRELLVLRLYGELEPSEAEALERALAGDEESRRFAEQLASVLGRTLGERAPASSDEAWEREWAERLQLSVEASYPVRSSGLASVPPRQGHWLLWAAAAGFAAGVFLTRLAEDDPAAAPQPAAVAVEPPNSQIADASGFERDGPPPRATGSGPLTRIGWLLDR